MKESVFLHWKHFHEAFIYLRRLQLIVFANWVLKQPLRLAWKICKWKFSSGEQWNLC